MGSKRLTDRQKKKIIADYIQLQNYTRTAKLNDVAESTVRKIVKENPECADLCERKKEQNAQDMLAYMESKQGEAQEILGLYLKAMADPDKIAEATLPQLSTAFGTIVDKFAMLGGQSGVEVPDDGLVEALNAAADLSPPDDVDLLPKEEDDNAEN
nr:MAG TPA: helix-turn-helix domain protein [Caudoviricetes sp.]